MRIIIFSIAYVLHFYNHIYFHNYHRAAALIANPHTSHLQVIRALVYPLKKVHRVGNLGRLHFGLHT